MKQTKSGVFHFFSEVGLYNCLLAGYELYNPILELYIHIRNDMICVHTVTEEKASTLFKQSLRKGGVRWSSILNDTGELLADVNFPVGSKEYLKPSVDFSKSMMKSMDWHNTELYFDNQSGYRIYDFQNNGMLRVDRNGIEAAKRDGIPFLSPIEIPHDFALKFGADGWIDIAKNREKMQEYYL